MNPTNEQELNKILDILIDSVVEARMRWHKQSQRARQEQSGNSGFTRYQSELDQADNTAKDAIMQLITAHTNAEIAKVLDRAKQRFHEPIEHDGSYISISVIDKTFDELIQAERAKLKEVK
jgi:hypothetical protein